MSATAVSAAERAVADVLVWSPSPPVLDVELDPADYTDPTARAVVDAWRAGPPDGWQAWHDQLAARGVPDGLVALMGPCDAPWHHVGSAAALVARDAARRRVTALLVRSLYSLRAGVDPALVLDELGVPA
ncbi:MAG: hypothetical protein IPM45_15630 [Acidimicrobiales bacterium]|nr:hypothetical protein [Acidimicrobiales bacterium]